VIPVALHTATDRLVWAYRFGHAWNPDPRFANLRNLDEGRVRKMDGSERDAKALIASWQQLDINVSRLVAAFHGRELEADGDVGPASEAVMRMARCAMPDYAPPPEASFHYDDPELQKAVESYQQFAEEYKGGNGSWPKGCDPNVANYHSVVVRLDSSSASTHQKGILKDVLKMVEDTEAEIGQSVRHVVDGSYTNPQHDVKFQYIAGGVIGFAYFPTPNTCQQTVTARIDNSFNASTPVLAELLTHEYKGHSDGLEHSRGGIMNPSIGNPSVRASWKGDPHQQTKFRYFGGVAIPSGPSPNPPPVPPPVDPTDLWAGASIVVNVRGKPPRRFVPAIEV
jgi:hypothetical protein